MADFRQDGMMACGVAEDGGDDHSLTSCSF